MISFVYSQSVPDEKILEMKTAFAKYDADGSGMLSNDEFRRIAPDMGVRHAAVFVAPKPVLARGIVLFVIKTPKLVFCR
jgi:hypothetical protein